MASSLLRVQGQKEEEIFVDTKQGLGGEGGGMYRRWSRSRSRSSGRAVLVIPPVMESS
jgi:hypothetical protein